MTEHYHVGSNVTILRFPKLSVDIEHVREAGPDYYSFFKWWNLTNLTRLGTPEHLVARAIFMKYSRRIQKQALFPMEAKDIEEAEAKLKASNDEIKRRKAAR